MAYGRALLLGYGFGHPYRIIGSTILAEVAVKWARRADRYKTTRFPYDLDSGEGEPSATWHYRLSGIVSVYRRHV